MTTVVNLHKAGILRDEEQNKPEFAANTSGFDAAPIHISMLNDKQRTLSFLRGIQEVVQPGDVVLDIGTGTGVLAIAAAHAGARHVYAIEASGIGKIAEAIFKANGFADRITLIGGWSTQVTLPEKADVLISEIIGNEPLGERVLETTMDALKRLLKPNARLVPNKVKIFGLPVTIPMTELMKYTFVAESLRDWQSSYNIDFNPLAEASRNSSQPFFINPFLARDWESLSEPIQLAEVDLKSMSQLLIDNTLSVTTNVSGRLDGVLIYFEIELGPTTQMSTYPVQTDKDCSWYSPVWILPEPLNLQAGDRFTVTYRYRATEDQYRVSVARNE
jgi:ubiquinone/menaquinone biosynthesis C-methylase UbiE